MSSPAPIALDKDEAMFLLNLLDQEKTALEYRMHLEEKIRADWGERGSPCGYGLRQLNSIVSKIEVCL